MSSSSPLRELLILRHAKSDHGDPTLADFDRPLSERGKEDAHKMGRWMVQQKLFPDHIVTSPSRRTLQTLKRARSYFDAEGLIHCDVQTALYEASLTTLLDLLANIPDSAKRTLVVGHNPSLELALTYLTNETRTESEVKLFPTCALAHFIMPADWRNLVMGSGKLVHLWHVKTLPELTD